MSFQHNISALNEGEEWALVQDHLEGDSPEVRQEYLRRANNNIEKYRKSDSCVQLPPLNGMPRAGVKVEVEQLKHGFVFGCSSGGTLAEEIQPGRAARNDLFAKLFNGTTAKCYWDEKWHQPIERVQGQRITKTFLDEVDWALAKGLVVRGHPLVWTVPKAIPQWMSKLSYERQLKLMEENCRALIAATQGRVKLWDLVNEMLWEPSLRNLSQRDWPQIESTEEILTYVAPAMEWALDQDPDSHYVLNDYGLEVDFTPLKNIKAQDQRNRFVELAIALKDRGLAPGALGTQAHCGKWFPLSTIAKTFSDLSKAGLPLQVSEFWAHDMDCPDNQLQGPELEQAKCEYVKNYYTLAFGQPNVEHISYWGGEEFFTRGGYVGTLLYETLYQLIHHDWKTQTQVVSDGEGQVKFRGFKGTYVIRWYDENGRSQCLKTTLA